MSELNAAPETQALMPAKRLIPCSKWNLYHEWPPAGGLRHLIFHSKTNGFEKVIRRVNRRVLIDEQAFFAYVEEKSKEGAK